MEGWGEGSKIKKEKRKKGERGSGLHLFNPATRLIQPSMLNSPAPAPPPGINHTDFTSLISAAQHLRLTKSLAIIILTALMLGISATSVTAPRHHFHPSMAAMMEGFSLPAFLSGEAASGRRLLTCWRRPREQLESHASEAAKQPHSSIRPSIHSSIHSFIHQPGFMGGILI